MKFIYLDQNKWIDLARAEDGRPDGVSFVSTLSIAREAVRSGEAVFPLSFPHCHETGRAPRLSQRKCLARLMVELSQGVVLRSLSQVIRDTLRDAVRVLFGEPTRPNCASPFGRGLEDVVGFRLENTLGYNAVERAKKLRPHLDTPSAWTDVLSHSLVDSRKKTNARLAEIGKQAAVAREDDRELWKGSSDGEIRRILAARATLHFIDDLQQSLGEIGRTMEQWGEMGPDRLLKFWESIPCVSAQIELELALHRDKSKKWTSNDLADLNAMSLAIPYCDFVVTEKYWTHVARTRGLGTRFATSVVNNLSKLDEFLTQHS